MRGLYLATPLPKGKGAPRFFSLRALAARGRPANDVGAIAKERAQPMPTHRPVLLTPGADLAAELPRLAAMIGGEAAAGLARTEAGDGEGIHEARRWLKRLRALLRLYEAPLGAAFIRRDSEARAIARAIGPLRDDQALHETIALVRHVVPGKRAPAVARLADRLGASVAARPHGEDMALIAATREAAERLAAALARACLAPTGPDHLAAGLRDTYRRARRGLAAVRRDASPDALHALRRHTNYHRHHVRLLMAAWPAVLSAREKEASRLHELLGVDRDFLLLAACMRDELGYGASTAGDEAALLRAIERHRGRTQDKALRLAAHLFVEKPEALTSRLIAHWRAAAE